MLTTGVTVVSAYETAVVFPIQLHYKIDTSLPLPCTQQISLEAGRI